MLSVMEFCLWGERYPGAHLGVGVRNSSQKIDEMA